MSNNDPVKGLIAICEHLANRGLMTQEEFDEFVRKMQDKPIHKKPEPVKSEKKSFIYKIKKKLGWD